MWSKITVCGLAILFLLTITGPIIANDGRAREAIETEPGDEHPWGGDGNDDDNPGISTGGLTSVRLGAYQSNLFFFIGAEQTWILIRSTAGMILSHPQTTGGTVPSSPDNTLDTVTNEAGNN